jgi:hypothetical protein
VQFVDIPENAIHSIEREIQLSRRTQRPARKATLRKSNGRKLRRRKLSRKLTARKTSKTKTTPRKSR